MADEKVEIEIVLDDGSIQKGFLKVESQAKKTGEAIDNSLSFKNASKALIGLAAALGAIQGIKALVGFFADGAKKASEQNDAVSSLNTALALTGRLLPGVSENIQAFSESLERTTKFEGEAILQSAALIQQLARLDSQGLQRATSAATDLASALGIDLSTATTLVAKAATGNISAFSRYGIEIQKGKTDAETFANTLKILESRFAGAGAAAASTFSGQTNQLSKAFDDLGKATGRFITQSPALLTAIKSITEFTRNIADKVGSGSTDFFKDLIINFSIVAQAGTQSALAIADSFILAALRAQQAWLAFKVLVTAGLSDAFNTELASVNTKIDEILNKNYADNPVITFFDELILKVQETSGKLTEFGENGVANITNIRASMDPVTFGELATSFGAAFEIPAESARLSTVGIMEQNDKLKKSFAEAGVAARNQLGSGIGNAFAKVGEAFAKGENALKAFLSAFVGAIGQMAIQSGTRFILEGLAFLTVPGFQGVGTSMIAAGAALATFGGALSALSGGGGGGGASTGGSSVDTGSASQDFIDEGAVADIPEKTTQVAINVEGTVLNPIDVGNQIAQILNDAFSAGGTRVVTV